MAKKKNRSAASRRAEHTNKTGAAAGVYPISTGEAELVPDGYHADGWLLLINGVQSSHVIVGQPRMLDFEYMRWIAAVLDSHIQTHLNPDKLRITHLGGGACSLARYCADVYPNSRNTVVELDARLAEYVRDWFDIPKSPRVKIRVGDASTITRSFAPASRDVVIRDVFAVDKTPAELATALLEVFEYVSIVSDSAMLKGRRRGNIILAGSHAPLPQLGSVEAASISRVLMGGGVPAQYWDTEKVRVFARKDA